MPISLSLFGCPPAREEVADASDAGSHTVQPLPEGCAPVQPRPRGLTVDGFVGVNGFVDDPLEVLAVAGIVREYHEWRWDEGNGEAYAPYPNNQNKWSPSYVVGWDFDSYYGRLRQATPSIVVSPVLQNGVPWLNSNVLAQPAVAGASLTDPASYAAHADHLFQFMARYGSTAVDVGRLKLAPDQRKVSGLGLISYVENWNEPDAWFRVKDSQPGSPGYFSAAQFGAMASADYDGHCTALGPTFGARNADPSARLVMGGLAGLTNGDFNLPFLRELKTWADQQRGGSFPADVLNVHHYSSQSGGTGISPEQDGLFDKLRTLVKFRDESLPEQELWLSEFGYDINGSSPQRAPRIGTLDEYSVQGAWIVRSYLTALEAGVDRAFVYVSRDEDHFSDRRYASAGLTYYGSKPGGLADHSPKAAWYFVATLRTRLTGMVLLRAEPAAVPGVKVLSFARSDGGGGAYALWAPSSEDRVIPAYQLALSPRATQVSQVTLQNAAPSGVEAPLSVNGASVAVDVSEVPKFVLVDAID